MVFTVSNGDIDKLCVFGLLRGGEDEGWVGGSILRLVLVDGSEITRVADDGGAGGLQLIERGGHGDYSSMLAAV